MTHVVWTRPARDDLREIRAYIARDSALYARLVVERLLRAVDRLQLQVPPSVSPPPE